ncbi:MAG TPA: TIGR03435 family protein, partial [Gammaproteobacteria bacterium]
DGRYKLTLKWTPDDVAAAGGTGPDAPPDLFTAIQEQLGLKLEPAKGQVPVLAIDKVTMPTEN